MMTVTATELKNKTGEQLQAAIKEPVLVKKSGRPAFVLMSVELYNRYKALEDRYWGETAKAAAKGGFLSTEESEDLLTEMLNAAG